MFRLKTKTNGRFPACDRSVLMPRGIFSHRHENLFSWAREFRLFVTSSNRPTGRAEGRRPPQPPPSSFQLPRTPFPSSLYIEQIPEASRRWGGAPFAKVGGRPSRSWGAPFAETDPPCPKRVLSPEPTPGIGMRGRRDRGLQGKRPRSLGQKTAVSRAKDRGLLEMFCRWRGRGIPYPPGLKPLFACIWQTDNHPSPFLTGTLPV